MKKIIIIITSVFLFASCSFKKDTSINVDKPDIKPSLTKEEKVEQFKRRATFRSIITKGDFYSIKNEKENALRYYLGAYARLKGDIVLEKKIAETYFDLKNYEKSLEFFKKIPPMDLDNKSSEEMVLSLMYTNPRTLKKDLENININSDLKNYYGHVFSCYNGIKNCITDLKSYTGSYEKTLKIKDLLLNFEKTGNTDSNYKYALMAGQFFENKDYLATIKIGEETLTRRPDYKSILKLTGYAYYEMGNNSKANDFLQKYYTMDPKDFKITYLLGIINFNLENYVSSNLYFNSAVLNGYKPKIELEKRLAYNYYILDDKKSMFKVFRYMLDEEGITEDDYSVALYASIEANELSKSMLWANKGITKFPLSDNLLAFRGWIFRLSNEKENSIKDLELSLKINHKNPIALFNLGILSSNENNFSLAKKYFEYTIDSDKNGVFGIQAQDELKDLDIKEKEYILSQSGETNTGITN